MCRMANSALRQGTAEIVPRHLSTISASISWRQAFSEHSFDRRHDVLRTAYENDLRDRRVLWPLMGQENDITGCIHLREGGFSQTDTECFRNSAFPRYIVPETRPYWLWSRKTPYRDSLGKGQSLSTASALIFRSCSLLNPYFFPTSASSLSFSSE